MDSVALQEGVELFQFNPVLLQLFVLRAEVTGGGLSLRPGFGAFENDLLTHKLAQCARRELGSRPEEVWGSIGIAVDP